MIVEGNLIRRPPGVRLDTGGTGKGLAADLLAQRLDGRWAVDCGGDIRVSAGEPFEVNVRHPLTHEPIHTLQLSDGAVATSGLDTRLWRAPDGTPRHHLLDPRTERAGVDGPRRAPPRSRRPPSRPRRSRRPPC